MHILQRITQTFGAALVTRSCYNYYICIYYSEQ